MDDELKKWSKLMESNVSLAARSSARAPSWDWSEAFDDLGAEEWEEHFDGPDDLHWESAEYDDTDAEHSELAELDYPASLRAELHRFRNRTIIGTYSTLAEAAAVARRSVRFVVTRADSSPHFIVFSRKR